MRWKKTVLFSMLLLTAFVASATEPPQPMVSMDENVWIAFYDVPSRRFRDIRAAFIRHDYPRVAKDLVTSASHLTVEANRALPAIAERLSEVSRNMTLLSEQADGDQVTLADLDSVFARAHWLLAQHYLDMASRSRQREQNRNAGRYLWATAHHMERAVLWSDARVDRKLRVTLDGVRDLAGQLQDENQAAKAYRERPMVKAEKLLRALGRQIDRPVVLPVQTPDS